MMMNIRGLILDDPEHTVHLQTLQFAAPNNSGREIEEVASRLGIDHQSIRDVRL
jgi:hypothetical protein